MRNPLPRRLAGLALISLLGLISVSCGGGPGARPLSINEASGNIYSFIADAPPPGTSILKFEITLDSAVLCPQVGSGGECQGLPQVSLLANPVEIELNQLQLQSAFLSLRSVTAGTFAGVRLTFSNPELKILAADGTTIVELEPPGLTLSPATVTPTFSGGLTIAGDSNTGLLIDFNVLNSIQSTGDTITGISPAVSLVLLPASTQQPIQELEDTNGRVANLTKTCPTGTFTLVDSLTGLSIAAIRFDGTTEINDGLTCETLANNQIVETDMELRSPTLQTTEFFASKIELVNEANDDGLEGHVFQVASATQFVLFVEGGQNIPGAPAGSFVAINIDAENTLFRIDTGDLPVESAAFAAGADLLAGQKVEVDVENGSLTLGTDATGCDDLEDNCAANAEKIKLKRTTITGRVGGTSDPNFTFDTLPAIFGAPAVFRALSADCQACSVGFITATTVSNVTEFEGGLTGFSGLGVGDIVTVRGLLIKNGFQGPVPGNGSPQLIAQKVRRRAP